MFYTVDISDEANVKCTCSRYFDEGVPCQHIISVYRRINKLDQIPDMIDRLYDRERLSLAFPAEVPFMPVDREEYSLNPRVTLQEVRQKRGAPQKLRFASTGERFTGNC